MIKHRYNLKIFAYFSLLFIVFATVIVFFQRKQERDYKTESIRNRLEEYADLCSLAYLDQKQDSLTSSNMELKKIVTFLPEYLRVSIVDRTGIVRYDNEVSDLNKTDNHLLRPEIQQSLVNRTGHSIRFSQTLNYELYYFSKHYQDYFVRLAMPYQIEYKNFLSGNNLFLYFVMGVFLLALLTILFYADKFAKSVQALRNFVSTANKNQGKVLDVQFPHTELGDLGQQVMNTYKILEQSNQRVKQEREKLLQHFAISDEGIAFFSPRKEHIYANSHFVQLLNKILDEPTFLIDERILKIPELEAIEHFLDEQQNSERSNILKYKICKNEQHYSVRVQVFPDRSFEIILANITKQEHDRQLKHDMTNNIAHELRTPVSSIRAYVETLIDQPNLPTEKVQHFLKRSYDQLIRLSELIGDVSLLSKIEEGSELYPLSGLKINEVVNEVASDLEIKIKESGLQFVNHVAAGTIVHANATLLYAIIRNLMENSIKYATNASKMELFLSTSDANYCYFCFADDGIGVKNDVLDKLFDRFYRVDEGRSRMNGGSGLGLSIVRNAVQIHGGQISAKNRHSGGLEILFSLAKHS